MHSEPGFAGGTAEGGCPYVLSAKLFCSAGGTCMRRFAFLFVLLFSLPAFSQAKRPFTFEDMMKLKRVGEPVPSPDGKWVLFAAVDVDLEANKKTSHIWIVPLSGGPERAISSPIRTATVRAGLRTESVCVSIDQRGRIAGLGGGV